MKPAYPQRNKPAPYSRNTFHNIRPRWTTCLMLCMILGFELLLSSFLMLFEEGKSNNTSWESWILLIWCIQSWFCPQWVMEEGAEGTNIRHVGTQRWTKDNLVKWMMLKMQCLHHEPKQSTPVHLINKTLVNPFWIRPFSPSWASWCFVLLTAPRHSSGMKQGKHKKAWTGHMPGIQLYRTLDTVTKGPNVTVSFNPKIHLENILLWCLSRDRRSMALRRSPHNYSSSKHLW